MTDHIVTISTNTLVDRLRTLHSELVAENRHTDALLVDLAIQAIKREPGHGAVLAELEAMVTQSVLKHVRAEFLRNAARFA
jgi:hypothetical protein